MQLNADMIPRCLVVSESLKLHVGVLGYAIVHVQR